MHPRHDSLDHEDEALGEADRAWDAYLKQCPLPNQSAQANRTRWRDRDRSNLEQTREKNTGTKNDVVQEESGTEHIKCIAYSTSKRHKLVLQSTTWTLFCQDCWVELPGSKLESQEKEIQYHALAFENIRSAGGSHWERGCMVAETLEGHTCSVRIALHKKHGRIHVIQVRYDINARPGAQDVHISKASATPTQSLELHTVEASFLAAVDKSTLAQVLDSPSAAVGKRENWLQFWHIEEIPEEGLALVPQQALDLGPEVGWLDTVEGVGSTCVLGAGGDSFCPSAIAVAYTDGTIALQQMLGDGTSHYRMHDAPITCLGEVFLQQHQNLDGANGPHTLLVSGASDGSMALLDLEEESVFARWTPFASRVAAVYTPPVPLPNESPSWIHSCFVAVDCMGTICIYDIASKHSMHTIIGLPCQPLDIAWDVPRAYLICLCKNSGVVHGVSFGCKAYVWDILSGKLERTFVGSVAMEFFREAKKNGNESLSPGGLLPQLSHLATASSCSSGGEEDTVHGQWRPIRAVSVLQNAMVLDINVRSLLARALPSICTSVGAVFRVLSKGGGPEDVRRLERNRALTALRLALAALHFWGVDESLDQMLHAELAVHPLASLLPVLKTTTTVLEDGTVMFGMVDSGKQDPTSSTRVLAVLAITNLLISEAPNAQNACVALTTFYGLQIWEQFGSMVVADLFLFATHWEDPSQPVRDAAHMLMASSIRQLSPKTLQDILGFDDSGFLKQLRCPEENFSMRILTACAACAAAPDHVREIAPSLASSVVPHLVRMVLQAPAPYSAAAASILVDGLKCNWGELLGLDLAAFMKEVLVLYDVVSVTGGTSRIPQHSQAVLEPSSETFWQAAAYNSGAIAALGQTLRHPADSEHVGVKGSAASTELMHCRAALSRLLPALAAADPLLFFTIVVQRMVVLAPNSSAHIHGLMTAVQLVQQYPAVAVTALPQLRSLLMLAISPLVPERRATCLQASTALVKELVGHLPSVDYFPDTMLFAVSISDQLSSGAPLVEIFDLHNAVKRYVLLDEERKRSMHKHASSVSAVSFDSTGLRAAALMLESSCILIWDLQVPWRARITNKPAELRPHSCIKSSTSNHSARVSGITPTTIHKLKMSWNGASQVDVCYCNNLMLSFAL